MRKITVPAIFFNLEFMFWLLVVLTSVVATMQYNFGQVHLWNIHIFRMSFFNLIHHPDVLYTWRYDSDGQLIDIFKYSPAFALLFAPLSLMPLKASILFWNLLNVLLFFFAIRSLPFDNKKKSIILWLSLPELIVSIESSQSNLLMAAFIIFAFAFMEKQKLLLATLCIVSSIFIKLFGIVALIMFLFYPDKLKFIGYTVLWSVVFFFLPLLVVSVSQLEQIYESWLIMLKHDDAVSWQLSVMGVAKAWFGVMIPKIYFQLIGAVLLTIPLISYRSYQNFRFRLLYLCAILLWVVTFNHKAESPSFIIAMAATGIWYVSESKTPFTIFLMLFTVIITSISRSDILPTSLREGVIAPYAIKGFPTFVLWCIVQYKIYAMAFKPQSLVVQGSIDGSKKL